MVIVKHHADGYDEFRISVNELSKCCGKQVVFVYFCGTKLPNGESWCDDCERAWPVVSSELDKLESCAHLVYVEVGDRENWKNPSNQFRKDPQTRLMVIPTIFRWPGPKKLEGDQCEKPELVQMLLNDEDD